MNQAKYITLDLKAKLSRSLLGPCYPLTKSGFVISNVKLTPDSDKSDATERLSLYRSLCGFFSPHGCCSANPKINWQVKYFQ